MADAPARNRFARLAALGGSVAIATFAVTAFAVGGGIAIGLSPLLIAVLCATVIGVTLAWLLWRTARHGSGSPPGMVAVFGHFLVVSTVVLVVIQVVPYGREHSNPPITGEPAWSSPQTRQLMVNACYDCHSNEVNWPWYTSIAPLSWAATEHVDEGRRAVNYSEFATGGGEEAEETIETILEGSMPPYYYTLFGLHSEADLTEDEVAELVAGLRATPGLDDDERDDDIDDDDEDDD